MYRINTDLSVDTVRIYFMHSFFHIDSAIWRRIDDDMYFCCRKNVRFTYNSGTATLTAEFSASRLANGCNAFPYEYHQYTIIRDVVERELFAVTGRAYHMSDAKISRIDVYRTLEFDSIDKARGFITALNTAPDAGRIKHKVYGDDGDGQSDYVDYTKGDLVKAYVKNDDPALPEELRDILPPTVRIEAECKKRADAKGITNRYSAEAVLKYPAIWVEIYNATLDKLKRGGRILPMKTLIRTARMLLKEKHPKMRTNTVNKRIAALRKIIKGKAKPDRNTAGLVYMLRANGICLCCSDTVDTLIARDVMPMAMQAMIEMISDVIAGRLINAVKKHSLHTAAVLSAFASALTPAPSHRSTA